MAGEVDAIGQLVQLLGLKSANGVDLSCVWERVLARVRADNPQRDADLFVGAIVLLLHLADDHLSRLAGWYALPPWLTS